MVDPSGDLLLHVGQNLECPGDLGRISYKIRVSSRKLKFACKSWHPILDSANLDAAHDTPLKVLSLPDDEPKGWLLLSRIAHLEFDRIPFYLDIDTFYEVSAICAKYDCHELVKPFLREWCQHKEFVEAYKKYPGEMLFITSTFALGSMLIQACKFCILNAEPPYRIVYEGLSCTDSYLSRTKWHPERNIFDASSVVHGKNHLPRPLCR